VVAVARWDERLERRWHSGKAPLPGGKSLAKHVGAELLHRARGPENPKCRIEGKERLKHVLLIPEAQIGFYEFFRVIERRKNVVEVDEYPGREFGQNAQADVDHVAVYGDHVAGVDEKYVIGAKGTEELEGRLLHRAGDELRQAGHSILKERRRMRLDRNEVARRAFGGIFSRGGSKQQRGVAAAHFDNAPRLATTNERVCNLRVYALEKTIAEMELVPIAVFGLREVPLLREWENVVLQAVYLFGDAEIDSSARLAGIPVLAIEGLESRYGEVKMRGRYIYAKTVLNRLEECRHRRPDAGALSETAQAKNLKFPTPLPGRRSSS